MKKLVQVTTENSDIFVVEVESMEVFDDKMQFAPITDLITTKDGTRIRCVKIVSYKEMQ